MTAQTLGHTGDLEQLGLVVARLPIGVIIFSKRTGNVVYANNAARRLLHPHPLRPGAPVPDPWPDLSLPQYAERLVTPGLSPDVRVPLEGNRVYAVSGIAARETNSGVVLIEDVSEQERRSRAEREFVANAAHELLTPLTGIVSAAHVLEAGAKDVPEDRDQFIAHIAKECDRLTRIARSLLVLARAQSGEELPRLEIVPLGDLLREAVTQVSGRVAVDCDESLTVLADADLLIQALVNLVTNAIRHGSGAEVRIAARRIGGNLVEIDIVDAGAAGPSFGDFRKRFRSAGGRDSGGFGLGLSIAEQSLSAIGGSLLLDGRSARIQLPRGGVSE